MTSKSGSGSKRKAGGSESTGKHKEGRREKGEKEKNRGGGGGGGRDSRGEGSIDRPSVFSRLGTKMGGANNRGTASNSSGAPAWSNRGSF